MTTATATKPRKIESPKYPGWAIERTGPTTYFLTRPGGVYSISVTHGEAHGWCGELLTRQRGGWAPAKTPYVHAVLGCVQEADRREKAIRKYGAKPLAGSTK